MWGIWLIQLAQEEACNLMKEAAACFCISGLIGRFSVYIWRAVTGVVFASTENRNCRQFQHLLPYTAQIRTKLKEEIKDTWKTKGCEQRRWPSGRTVHKRILNGGVKRSNKKH